MLECANICYCYHIKKTHSYLINVLVCRRKLQLIILSLFNYIVYSCIHCISSFGIYLPDDIPSTFNREFHRLNNEIACDDGDISYKNRVGVGLIV